MTNDRSEYGSVTNSLNILVYHTLYPISRTWGLVAYLLLKPNVFTVFNIIMPPCSFRLEKNVTVFFIISSFD